MTPDYTREQLEEDAKALRDAADMMREREFPPTLQVWLAPKIDRILAEKEAAVKGEIQAIALVNEAQRTSKDALALTEAAEAALKEVVDALTVEVEFPIHHAWASKSRCIAALAAARAKDAPLTGATCDD
jgi:hypothetical protein